MVAGFDVLSSASGMPGAEHLREQVPMIFEMRTYRLQPGSVPEVEKRFGEALTERV